ncbi:MAG: multidrug efflux SMR transporter [Pseudomonadales bacterium]|nr:multidrug efflux SMR transporter [Pseudomonadales bacterium]
MAWVYLLLAGVFEVQWVVTMKYTEGFTKLWPSVFCVLGMAASVYFLAVAQKTLPLGTSYVVWTGIGVVGATLFGIILFNEPKDGVRLLCIGLIVMGILGLKFSSGH